MATQQRVGTHATTVRQEAGVLSVVYHSTEVVRASSHSIRLDTGGYFTATTKTRMNQASNQYGLGFTVSQKAGQWTVSKSGKVYRFEGNTVEFPRS